MKTSLLIAAACSMMLMSSSVQAQTTLTPAQEKKVASELKRFGADLNLTATQKDQMRTILGEETSQADAVRNDSSLSKADKAAKMADIRKSGHDKISNVLSPDQLRKWDAEMAKAKNAVPK